MGTTIGMPLWFVVLAGVLAFAGLYDRFLNPAVQWYFRSRANRAIDELNTRLRLKIHPFKMTKRQVLVDRLAHDTKVLAEVELYAKENDMPMAVALRDVERYAKEIVPTFSAYAYFKVGTRLARFISMSLYRVRLAFADRALLETMDTQATIIFVMNHRSNMDYILVTYMASTATALSYAVGEWARIPILQTLIRSMGAYFIRRDARNSLYRKVLARYVQMATEAGVTQAMFPEGGLSRDGKLRPVKLGLISYIVEGFDPNGRDVLFIPVGLNYDRVIEDRSLVAEIDGQQAKLPFYAKAIKSCGFIWRNMRLRLKGRWHKFGYACVAFGKPLGLKEFMKAQGAAHFDDLDSEQKTKTVACLGDALSANGVPQEQTLEAIHKDGLLGAYFVQSELTADTFFGSLFGSNPLDELAQVHWGASDRRIFDRLHMRTLSDVTEVFLAERTYTLPEEQTTGDNAHVDGLFGKANADGAYSGHARTTSNQLIVYNALFTHPRIGNPPHKLYQAVNNNFPQRSAA